MKIDNNMVYLIIRDPINQGEYSDYQDVCMRLEQVNLTKPISQTESFSENKEAQKEETSVCAYFNISHQENNLLTIYNEYLSVFKNVEVFEGFIPIDIEQIYIIGYTIQQDGNNCIIRCTF